MATGYPWLFRNIPGLDGTGGVYIHEGTLIHVERNHPEVARELAEWRSRGRQAKRSVTRNDLKAEIGMSLASNVESLSLLPPKTTMPRHRAAQLLTAPIFELPERSFRFVISLCEEEIHPEGEVKFLRVKTFHLIELSNSRWKRVAPGSDAELKKLLPSVKCV